VCGRDGLEARVGEVEVWVSGVVSGLTVHRGHGTLDPLVAEDLDELGRERALA
jgi:hypothetical protein